MDHNLNSSSWCEPFQPLRDDEFMKNEPIADKTMPKKFIFYFFILAHELAAIFTFFLSIKLIFLNNSPEFHANNSLELKITVPVYFIFHVISFTVQKKMAFNVVTKYFPGPFLLISGVAIVFSFFSMTPGTGAIFDLNFYELMLYLNQSYLLSYSILNLVKDDGTLKLDASRPTMNKVFVSVLILGVFLFGCMLFT